jgi:hypothetical protein
MSASNIVTNWSKAIRKASSYESKAPYKLIRAAHGDGALEGHNAMLRG